MSLIYDGCSNARFVAARINQGDKQHGPAASPERQRNPWGCHGAAWRLQANPHSVTNISGFLETARIAERGTFDAVFFADHSALDSSARDRPWQALDPALVLTAMAAVTERIGLVATASTTFEHPFHVARRVASLDHISKGRSAWNIVPTQQNETAPNFGLPELPPHADRYQRAEEFVEAVVKLWDSWDDDALVADAGTGVYADLARVHPINHDGYSFSVRGPLNVPRSPQGRPDLVQAGASEASQRLGSRWADALFTVQRTFEAAQTFYASVKALAAGLGRSPDGLNVLPGLYPVIGSTEAEARTRKAEMDALLDFDQERVKLAERFGIDADRLHLDRPFPSDILDHVSFSARIYWNDFARSSWTVQTAPPVRGTSTCERGLNVDIGETLHG